MATTHSFASHPLIFLCLAASFCFRQTCFGLKAKHLNLTTSGTHWSWAGATWYGSPDGAGSDGGACGYGNAVSQSPFSSMVTGIGPSLYKSGKECGACYKNEHLSIQNFLISKISKDALSHRTLTFTMQHMEIKCTKRLHPSCSGKPVRVVITDFCPGGPCVTDSAHFDLSGTAFGAMAKAGEEVKLRDAGVLKIRYARVACDYSGRTIAFHVDPGSNSNYFAVVIEYEEGDGDLAGVSLKEASMGSEEWRSMQQSWGAVWKLEAGSDMQPPFSIQLTSQYSRETIVAKNVIPENWKPGSTYRSLVNYL